jgi:hypothetical protein
MRSRRHPARAVLGLLVAAASCVAAPGCLRRDVSAEEPTTKIVFSTEVSQPAIDKVDVLVMVDDSSSMADKQRILANALPDLLHGLVQPSCVDAKTRAPTGTLADPLAPEGAQCPAGSKPAFDPITDMHVGVISSSMGAFGGDECKPGEAGRHNDDHAHLLARGEGGDVAEAGALHFLAWYPDVEANADKARHPEPPVPKLGTIDAFNDAFHRLVTGVGQEGCGLEAQLESVYHFLVQPDPWNGIAVANGRASYGPKDDVDGELLRQRAAFLRPDSLVAVILLSDEDDSSADPLALGGQGFVFENESPLPRATAACATDPISPACTTCAGENPDPSCADAGGYYTAEQDPVNVRFQHMKKRYGVDPQFPIARYVDALTKPKVPARDAEHDAFGNYAPKPLCTNPLFAARLPSEPNDPLCDLPRGPRTKDRIYFAVIGGVPNQLLPDGSDPEAELDWTKILGKDPSRYDESGIDPHMIASTDPRPGLPGPASPDDADPIHGREWETGGTDLQYACTFDLFDRAPDGSVVPVTRACGANENCDCDGKKEPPLCAPRGSDVQVKGKAYPTRRELMVARELGDHAIVASLCPKQLTRPDADDYGYRPAVRAVAARLADNIGRACLPRKLTAEDGSVACAVLAVLPDPGPDSDCQSRFGLASPSPAVLAQFRDRLAAEEGEAARGLPVCELPQLPSPPSGTCRDEDDPDHLKMGFCYAEGGDATSRCQYELLFTKPTTRLANARFTLECIQLSESPTLPTTGASGN